MDRFIVGTGRCGSTLLSRMLSEHADVLSLFEFFTGLDRGRRFDHSPMTGEELASLISAEQPFVTAVLRRGYQVEEITYPFDDGGRYGRSDALPWALVSMLPRLSDDPDALYDEMIAFVRAFPTRPAVQHYRSLFTWLGTCSGRAQWIERSGSSIEYLGDLARSFPRARFVHLHRDGRETALSMRDHHAYRLPICLLYDAPVDGSPGAGSAGEGEGGNTVRVSDLGEIDVRALPTGKDPISRILASRPSAEYFGRYWSDQIMKGLDCVSALAPERLLDVRFEELVAEPARVLTTIADFFELARGTGNWIERGASMVRRGIAPRRIALDAAERARLDGACRTAMVRLGRTIE
jgi:hypothetical protein